MFSSKKGVLRPWRHPLPILRTGDFQRLFRFHAHAKMKPSQYCLALFIQQVRILRQLKAGQVVDSRVNPQRVNHRGHPRQRTFSATWECGSFH